VEEIRTRMRSGHQPYIARLAGSPVAYGWAARKVASVGELGRAFTLSPADRYLWDFATLPTGRGQGVYPRLLRAILAHEAAATRFWIIHAPENRASGRGIGKGGFSPVGELSFLGDGQVALGPGGPRERAWIGAVLLGVPLLDRTASSALSACWRCVITPAGTI
jgi:GNAT superfamily N-acetyltransferase